MSRLSFAAVAGILLAACDGPLESERPRMINEDKPIVHLSAGTGEVRQPRDLDPELKKIMHAIRHDRNSLSIAMQKQLRALEQGPATYGLAPDGLPEGIVAVVVRQPRERMIILDGEEANDWTMNLGTRALQLDAAELETPGETRILHVHADGTATVKSEVVRWIPAIEDQHALSRETATIEKLRAAAGSAENVPGLGSVMVARPTS